MQQPTNVLRVAQQLVQALALMQDPLDIARHAAGCIRELLPADAVAIFSWDQPAQHLVSMYSTCPTPGPVHVRSGQGAVGRAFEHRRPTLVNDRPSRCDTPAWDMALRLQVVAAVPLIVVG